MITVSAVNNPNGNTDEAAGVVCEGVVQAQGAPQAVEGEGLHVGLVNNSVSVAIATLSVYSRDAQIVMCLTLLKFPILSWTVCSCCLSWEIVALADISLAAWLFEKVHGLEEVHGHVTLGHAEIKELAVSKFHDIRILVNIPM